MAEGRIFEAGWLKAELDAAAKEVNQWSAGMRRVTFCEPAEIRKSEENLDNHFSNSHEVVRSR